VREKERERGVRERERGERKRERRESERENLRTEIRLQLQVTHSSELKNNATEYFKTQ